jgi:hypothetical protein
MHWMQIAQDIQEAYNDFKIGINEKSRQVTLLYYKFREYEIKQGQPTGHQGGGGGRGWKSS